MKARSAALLLFALAALLAYHYLFAPKWQFSEVQNVGDSTYIYVLNTRTGAIHIVGVGAEGRYSLDLGKPGQ